MVETVRARCDRVVDGDTIDVVADLPLGVRRPVRLRLDGVDTAETYGTPESSPEDERGDEHTAFVSEWFEAVDGEAFPLTAKARAERRCKELRDDAEDCETVGATAGRP